MILSCKCMEKQISFEGIVHGVVLYKNDDTLQSFAFEMPFSTAIDFADVDAKHFCNGQAAVVNINCRKDKGNTLEITASLKCSFNLTKQVVESVVSGCELGEQLQDLNYSPMQLFIINKGDTLWDVCKQLHTTEEQLSKQNPHLVFPLEQSARIVVYRPIKR